MQLTELIAVRNENVHLTVSQGEHTKNFKFIIIWIGGSLQRSCSPGKGTDIFVKQRSVSVCGISL